MALKGASPEHEGEERPDRWELDEELVAVGARWGIDPDRDLVASQADSAPFGRCVSDVLDKVHPDLSTRD